ncbi:hypothetical protein XENTR_v10002752 [Xenopus tropicalis]|nr:hypothetical protein XENTR_v10002752 [Xenopus tropicalis]
MTGVSALPFSPPFPPYCPPQYPIAFLLTAGVGRVLLVRLAYSADTSLGKSPTFLWACALFAWATAKSHSACSVSRAPPCLPLSHLSPCPPSLPSSYPLPDSQATKSLRITAALTGI